MSWNPFASKPAPAEKKYDASTEFIEDPFADPFAEDDEGASFSSIQLPTRSPPVDVIRERPGQDDDSDAPRRINVDFNTLIGVNPAARSAISGVAPKKQQSKEAAYLKFSRRGVYERAMYNSGCLYLAGDYID
jgi:hypothetical protein